MPRWKTNKVHCAFCRNGKPVEGFACCKDCIKWLIREERKKRRRPRPQKRKVITMLSEAVQQDRCDACDLPHSSPRYSGHNCFDVIKGYGRQELAKELLALLESEQGHAPSSTLDVLETRLEHEAQDTQQSSAGRGNANVTKDSPASNSK